MSAGFTPREHVPLAPFTTLDVGGPARFFAEVDDEPALVDALAWARARSLRTVILGGGSNLLVADRGIDALVLRLRLRGLTERAPGLLDVAAGVPWDEVVAFAVSHDRAGIECLSGIPGSAGATPIQNVGAYGQEIAETLVSVRAVERSTARIVELDHAFCAFGYRDSVFKREAKGAYVITSVRFALRPGGAPSIRYAELAARLAADGHAHPTLADVRATVITLRRAKSMVLDRDAENGKSAGSFFMNPTIDAPHLPAIQARVAAAGVLRPGESMPAHPGHAGTIKLSAAWLIERAGFPRGFGEGRVGLSTRHTLALVNRGGASATELLAFARQIRSGVTARFGVTLHAEPVLEGFTEDELRDAFGP